MPDGSSEMDRVERGVLNMSALCASGAKTIPELPDKIVNSPKVLNRRSRLGAVDRTRVDGDRKQCLTIMPIDKDLTNMQDFKDD